MIITFKRFRDGALFFDLAGGRCASCNTAKADTMAPVQLLDGGELDTDSRRGSQLCRACSMLLWVVPSHQRLDWPAMTALDVEQLWTAARREQMAERESLAARIAAKTSVQDVQAALVAALNKAAGHEKTETLSEAVCHGR